MYQHTWRHGEEGRVTIDILMKLVVINTVQYIIISTQMTKQLQSTPNTFMILSIEPKRQSYTRKYCCISDRRTLKRGTYHHPPSLLENIFIVYHVYSSANIILEL